MRILKIIGRRWLKLAEILGNFQMILVLSLIYWTMMAVMAIPFKLLSDPMAQRDPGRLTWVRRAERPNDLNSARKQG
jgi:hypothetical protein